MRQQKRDGNKTRKGFRKKRKGSKLIRGYRRREKKRVRVSKGVRGVKIL